MVLLVGAFGGRKTEVQLAMFDIHLPALRGLTIKHCAYWYINLKNSFYVKDGGSKYMHYINYVINVAIMVLNKDDLSQLEIAHKTTCFGMSGEIIALGWYTSCFEGSGGTYSHNSQGLKRCSCSKLELSNFSP